MASLRRAELSDVTGITKLCDAPAQQLYNTTSIVSLIERATLAITAEDEQGEIVGHACFYDEPGLAAVDKRKWESWLQTSFQCDHYTPANVLFLRLFVANRPDVAASLLKALFVSQPDIRFCLLALPAAAAPALQQSSLAPHMKPLPPKADGSASSDAVFVCSWDAHYPNVLVRTARSEDYDDLMPIFDRQTESLNKRYGQFFLNTVIESQTTTHKALVAEVDGKPVGFMSVDAQPDLSQLLAAFELAPFNNLSITTESEVEEAQAAPAAPAAQPVQPVLSRSSMVVNASKHGSSVFGKQGSSHKLGSQRSSTTTTTAASLSPQPSQTNLPIVTTKIVKRTTQAAVSIKYFCMSEAYETRAGDFLDEVFRIFSDKDFVILTVPHSVPEIPLLSYFARVVTKANTTFSQELYVCHRFGLRSDIEVREAAVGDKASIAALVAHMDTASDTVVQDIALAIAGTPEKDGNKVLGYVATCAGQVAGVLVLRSARDDAPQLRAHFNLEEFVLYSMHSSTEHAYVCHYVLNPAFAPLEKFFLREAMRKGGLTCVYYRLFYPGDTPAAVQSTVPAVLDDMIPVRRRRVVQYSVDKLLSNAPSSRIRILPVPHALLFLTRKLMLEPKITVNARIVVVGGSDTALAFLESLFYKPHLRFTNVLLVSPHGLPAPTTGPAATFRSTAHAFTSADLKQMALQTWVHVVCSKMQQIDRAGQTITLQDGSRLAYDYLVLTPGKQYCNAANTASAAVPSVVDSVDAAQVLTQASVSQGSILVYGATADALSAVNSLLASGVAGSRISLILPSDSVLGAPEVSDHVVAAASAAGVSVQRGLKLVSVDSDSTAVFEKDGAKASQPFALLLLLHAKSIDPTTFKAINDACIVYDGDIVIDSSFRTNDPKVLAAGTAVKYSRKYRVDASEPSRHNSAQAGRLLAAQVLSMVDPLATPDKPDDATAPATAATLPTFTEPKVVFALLPGNKQYLHIQPSSASSSAIATQGRYLCSDQLKSKGSYFRIYVTQLGIIGEVLCLSDPGLQDSSNLLCLFGLHEKHLNNLVGRFDEGLIPDFFEYLRQPWTSALFHDRFVAFLTELDDLVKENPAVDFVEFATHARKFALSLIEPDKEGGESSDLAKETAKEKEAALQQLAHATVATRSKDRLLDFLTYNSYHLPMYARPGMW